MFDLRLPKVHCHRCGHTWKPMVKHPKACPCCHQYIWQKQRRAKEVSR